MTSTIWVVRDYSSCPGSQSWDQYLSFIRFKARRYSTGCSYLRWICGGASPSPSLAMASFGHPVYMCDHLDNDFFVDLFIPVIIASPIPDRFASRPSFQVVALCYHLAEHLTTSLQE